MADKLRRASSTGVANVAAVLTSRSIGGTTLSVGAGGLTNWATTTSVDFSTYRIVDGAITAKTDWTGRVNIDTNIITELEVTNGTDVGNLKDDIVVCLETSAWVNDIIGTLLTIFDSTGTLKPEGIASSALVNSSISTLKIANLAVTTAKIANAAVTPAKRSNPYKFRAYRDAALSIGATTTGKVTFDTDNYDTNNNFDATTNNRYVAPVAGVYAFNATVSAIVDGGNLYFTALYKNGVLVSQGAATISAPGTTEQSWTVSDEIQLAASDYVEVFFRNGSSGTKSLVVGEAKTYFSGHLVDQTL